MVHHCREDRVQKHEASLSQQMGSLKAEREQKMGQPKELKDYFQWCASSIKALPPKVPRPSQIAPPTKGPSVQTREPKEGFLLHCLPLFFHDPLVRTLIIQIMNHCCCFCSKKMYCSLPPSEIELYFKVSILSWHSHRAPSSLAAAFQPLHALQNSSWNSRSN